MTRWGDGNNSVMMYELKHGWWRERQSERVVLWCREGRGLQGQDTKDECTEKFAPGMCVGGWGLVGQEEEEEEVALVEHTCTTVFSYIFSLRLL